MEEIRNINKDILDEKDNLISLKIIECGDHDNTIVYYCIIDSKIDLQIYLNNEGQWEILNNKNVTYFPKIVQLIENHFS